MTARDNTRESGQEGSASESTRRQFLGAAAAVASIGVGGVGGVGDDRDGAELVYVDEGEPGWYPLDDVVAVDVWGGVFQEARLELIADEPDLDHAAELCRAAARQLEDRDAPALR